MTADEILGRLARAVEGGARFGVGPHKDDPEWFEGTLDAAGKSVGASAGSVIEVLESLAREVP